MNIISLWGIQRSTCLHVYVAWSCIQVTASIHLAKTGETDLSFCLCKQKRSVAQDRKFSNKIWDQIHVPDKQDFKSM